MSNLLSSMIIRFIIEIPVSQLLFCISGFFFLYHTVPPLIGILNCIGHALLYMKRMYIVYRITHTCNSVATFQFRASFTDCHIGIQCSVKCTVAK